MASKRDYVTTTEVDELIGSGNVTDLQISEAEEIIDDYVGPQEKFLFNDIRGVATAGGASTLTLQSDQQNTWDVDYLKGCWIEILGGTGSGQRRKISSQTKAGVITTESAWTTAPSTDSAYRIWQLGKFPRSEDVFYDTQNSVSTYYKSIPEKVRRAAAAQVEYMVKMGANFFQTDKSDLASEELGDYSYSKDKSAAGPERLLAPKAKLLLRGIKNIGGTLVVD